MIMMLSKTCVVIHNCVAGRCRLCVTCLATGANVIIGLGSTPVKPVTVVAWRWEKSVCDVVVKTGRGRMVQAIRSCHGSRQSQTAMICAHGYPMKMHGQATLVMVVV